VQPPPLVRRAAVLAAELGVHRGWADEVAELLHVLAGAAGRRRVTAVDVGPVAAAWIASALEPAVPFVIAAEGERRTAAARLFDSDPNVHVLHGEWRELLPPEAPFDLVVAEPASDPGALLGLLAPRGTAVVPAGEGRSAWLEHPELAAVRLLTSTGFATIVAVRRL
jgi:protein-L-isoaspartate O-methyltransferase